MASYLIHALCINLKWSYYTNEEELFCVNTELSNIKITLALAKLYMIDSRQVSNVLIFPGAILVDIQLATFLLLSSVSELSFAAKTKKVLITITAYK